jgi:hypothetical protein
VWLALHVAGVASAAQVRPVLGLYAAAEVLLLLWFARERGFALRPRVGCMIAVAAVLLAVAGNAPSFRNRINHGFWMPSDKLSSAMCRYWARAVRGAAGEAADYDKAALVFRRTEGAELVRLQNAYTRQAVREHPWLAARVLATHAAWNLLESHWNSALYFARLHWLSDDDYGRFRRSRLARAIVFCWIPFYLAVYAALARVCFRAACRRDVLFLAAWAAFCFPLLATFFTGQGARMRLFCEPVFLAFALPVLADWRRGRVRAPVDRRRGADRDPEAACASGC